MSRRLHSRQSPRPSGVPMSAEPLEPRTLMAAALTPIGPVDGSAVSRAVEFNGAQYFLLREGTTATALWKTDGTAAGTGRVAALPPPYDAPGRWDYPWDVTSHLVVAGGAMYFVGYAGAGKGGALWRSDGTTAGTAIVPGASAASLAEVSVYGRHLTVLNDRVYFIGYDGAAGVEVWGTDGTPAGGVAPVTNTASGIGTANLHNLQAAGGALYFGTHEVVGETEAGTVRVGKVWRSDGTPGGTRALREISPWPLTYPEELLHAVPTADGVYVVGGLDLEQLWGPGGDEPLVTLHDIVSPAAWGDGVVFAGSDPAQERRQWLFFSDGTSGGTRPILDLGGDPRPGLTYDDGIHRVGGFVRRGDALFFFYHGGLWRTDGTAAGTRKVRQFHHDATQSFQWGPQLTNVDGTLVFVANDGVHGNEVWKSDGTAAGTVMVADIDAGLTQSPVQLVGRDDGDVLVVATTGRDAGGAAVRTVLRLDPRGGVDGPFNGAPFAYANEPTGAGGIAGGQVRGYRLEQGQRTVLLDAGHSDDPDGDALAYEWDLDGDDAFDDATGRTVELTWGQLQLLFVRPNESDGVRVRVSDGRGGVSQSAAGVFVDRPGAGPVSALFLSARPEDQDLQPQVAVADDGRTGYVFRVVFASARPMDEASLQGQDVLVTAPDGAQSWATPVGFVRQDDASTGVNNMTVTYHFAAPGGTADAADGGVYQVRLVPGAVTDADGSTNFAHELGPVRATVETAPPTATLHAPAPTADDVYEFTVTYRDDSGIDPATIDPRLETYTPPQVGLRRVTGSPEGERLYVAVHAASKVQQPDGSWVVTYQAQDTAVSGLIFANGQPYSVWSDTYLPVKDVHGNALAARELGRFTTDLPRTGPDVILADFDVSLPRRQRLGRAGRATFTLAGVTWGPYLDVVPGQMPPAVDVTVYLTPNLMPRAGDVVLATLPAQAPGTVSHPRRLGVGFRIPNVLPPGEYRVIALADSGHALVEPNEANNHEFAFGVAVREPHVSLGVVLKPARRARRGAVLALVVEFLNAGNVTARGTATLDVTFSAPFAGEGVAPGESVRATETVAVNVRPHPDGRTRSRAKVMLRVPEEWAAGAAHIQVLVEPDAALAALNRGEVSAATESVTVV